MAKTGGGFQGTSPGASFVIATHQKLTVASFEQVALAASQTLYR